MRRILITVVIIIGILIGFFLIYINLTEERSGSNSAAIVEDKEIPIENKHIDQNEILILKMAHKFPESHPQHIALTQKFVPLIESGSNWEIRVEVYPNQQLGDEAAYVDGLRKGTIEMCIGSQSIAGLLPNLGRLELPYLFDSYEHFGKIMNSSEGYAITEGLDRLGLRNLGWTHYGFRQVSLTNVYPESDSRRMRLGTNSSVSTHWVLDIMGFIPRVLDVKQLAMAINQSLVDGYDFPLITAYYNGCTDKLAYLLQTNHVLATDMYLVNEDFWSGLSDEHRELISEVVAETVAYESELIIIAETEILDVLEAEKIPIVPFDSTKIKDKVYQHYISGNFKNDALGDLYKWNRNLQSAE